eukprot:1079600-Prymnesium_polylepis.2
MGAFTLEVPKSELPSNRTWLVRNTIRHNGASATVNRGSASVSTSLNHIYDQYSLQMDGGLLQGSGLQPGDPPEWGLTDEQNWVHEALQPRNPKWGLRIDRVNQQCVGRAVPDGDKPWAFYTRFSRNVIWRTARPRRTQSPATVAWASHAPAECRAL